MQCGIEERCGLPNSALHPCGEEIQDEGDNSSENPATPFISPYH